MKKFLGMVLVFAMVLSLVACGKKPTSNEGNNTSGGQTTTQPGSSTNDSNSTNNEGNTASGEKSDGKVTDPVKLGEAITYWVDGEKLFFKIKTSVEIDAHRYSIAIVNPGIYLTRDSEFVNRSIYEKASCFVEEFDKEYFDGCYVFELDNTILTDIASDESEWAPGTWSVLLFNEDTRLVLGQWLIVLEGGGKYHFEYSDSWLYGAGEDRKVKEFDSLEKEVESWFTFKPDESYDEWAVFNFDGYYLEQIDPEGYDKYYLMVCPEGDYTTYADADAVDLTYCGFGGLEYARCPYRFAFEQYMLENGKYTMVLARQGANVEVQFTAEKKGPQDWKMDFSNAKCPALESKHDGYPEHIPTTPEANTLTGETGSNSDVVVSYESNTGAVLEQCKLTTKDIQTSVGTEVTNVVEQTNIFGTAYDAEILTDDRSFEKYLQWLNEIADSCRKASTDGTIFEQDIDWDTGVTTPITIDAPFSADTFENASGIHIAQFCYKIGSRTIYVTCNEATANDNAFQINLQFN